MSNRRKRRPISKLVVIGFVLFFASAVIPMFTQPATPMDTSFARAAMWGKVSVLALILIAIGMVRTVFLWREAMAVDKAQKTAGVMGEMKSAQELTKLDGRYHIFNRFYLYHRGTRQEYDHVVVGPNGVFHVESKNWSGQVYVSDSRVRRSVKGNEHDAAEQMHRHHLLLEGLLRDNGLTPTITGILCFTNQNGIIRGRSSMFLHTRLSQLAQTIAHHSVGKHLTTAEINQISNIIKQNSQQHMY